MQPYEEDVVPMSNTESIPVASSDSESDQMAVYTTACGIKLCGYCAELRYGGTDARGDNG